MIELGSMAFFFIGVVGVKAVTALFLFFNFLVFGGNGMRVLQLLLERSQVREKRRYMLRRTTPNQLAFCFTTEKKSMVFLGCGALDWRIRV